MLYMIKKKKNKKIRAHRKIKCYVLIIGLYVPPLNPISLCMILPLLFRILTC